MGGEDSWPSAGLSPRPLCTDGALSRHRRHRFLLLPMLRAWAALGTPATPPGDDGQQLFLNRMEPQPKGPRAEPRVGVSYRSRCLPLFSFRKFQLAFKATMLKAIWKMLQVRGKKSPSRDGAPSGLRPAPPRVAAPGARRHLLLSGQAWRSARAPFQPRGAQGPSPGRAEDAEAKSSPATPSGSTDLRPQSAPSVPRPPVGSWGLSGPSTSLHLNDRAERRVQGREPRWVKEVPPGRTRSPWAQCPASSGVAGCVIRSRLAAGAGPDVILGCGVSASV